MKGGGKGRRALPARLRAASALVVALLYALLFFGLSGAQLGLIEEAPRLQLLPALLRLASNLLSGGVAAAAAAALILLLELGLALAAGRLYCAFLCPFGALQDGLGFLGRHLARRTRFFRPSPAKAGLPAQTVFASLALTLALGGLPLLLDLLEPWSAFGRLVSGLGRPLVDLAVNAAAYLSQALGSYAVSFREPRPDLARMVAALPALALAFIALFRGRLFCNLLCPTGLLLRLFSLSPRLGLRLSSTRCTGCGACAAGCPSASITMAEEGKRVPHFDEGSCVRCLGCIASCPVGAVSFGPRGGGASVTKIMLAAPRPPRGSGDEAISRRLFLARASGLGLLAGFASLGLSMKPFARRPRVVMNGYERRPAAPPGAMTATRFLGLCSACGSCLAVCPSGVLATSTTEWSLLDSGKPYLAYARAYCQFECDLCLRVCPTGALLPLGLETKKSRRLGKSILVRSTCIVVEKGTRCGACAEHCPSGAISMVRVLALPEPRIDEELCVGCGACETVCPAKPRTAIYVEGREVQDVAKALPRRPGDASDVQKTAPQAPSRIEPEDRGREAEDFPF
jgi:ferredoxin